MRDAIALQQQEKESIASFKTRIDHQIRANIAAGVPAVTEVRSALDFILKLDTRRYHGIARTSLIITVLNAINFDYHFIFYFIHYFVFYFIYYFVLFFILFIILFEVT